MHKLFLVSIALILVMLNGCTKEETEVIEAQPEEETEVIEAQPEEVEGVGYNFLNPQLANHTIILEPKGSGNEIILLFCVDNKVKYNDKVSGTFGLHETPSSILDINLTKVPHTIQLHDSYNGKLGDSEFNTGEVIGVVVDSGSLDAYIVKSVYTAPRAVCK